MKHENVWISYDLGVKGDYPGLYKWLDTHTAQECGNSIAYFKYDFKDNLIEELKTDLEKSIDFSKSDRIYIIFKHKKNEKLLPVGKFLIGNRKSSPWVGYAPTNEDIFDFEL